MLLSKLESKGLIQPPKWLATNTVYLTIMGSSAYGMSNDLSDTDLYGFAMPKKEILFPHLSGHIEGFGTKENFEQYQQHHIQDSAEDKMYDLTIFNITKFFTLLMGANPNVLESIFTPLNCVIHSTNIGNLVREKRQIFLHKGSYHKFLGYAYSQLHKMSIKNPQEGSKRFADVEKNGFDTKFACHLVRLALECEQILSTGDLNLQRDREHLKAIRRGEVSEKEIREWFSAKEKTLEKLYADSKLPHGPNEDQIKQLLLECIEIHYGSLDKFNFVNPNAEKVALKEIKMILEKHKV